MAKIGIAAALCTTLGSYVQYSRLKHVGNNHGLRIPAPISNTKQERERERERETNRWMNGKIRLLCDLRFLCTVQSVKTCC